MFHGQQTKSAKIEPHVDTCGGDRGEVTGR